MVTLCVMWLMASWLMMCLWRRGERRGALGGPVVSWLGLPTGVTVGTLVGTMVGVLMGMAVGALGGALGVGML